MKLDKQTRKFLLENNGSLATAESCTGGLLAHIITNSAGSSSYFAYGYVTYSDEAKIKELKIPKEIIEKYTSYSKEVAELMADSARMKANSTFGIAITGIAPPGDPDSSLPIGTVFVGISSANNVTHFEFQVNNHFRTWFKKKTVKHALKAFCKYLQE